MPRKRKKIQVSLAIPVTVLEDLKNHRKVYEKWKALLKEHNVKGFSDIGVKNFVGRYEG